MVTLQLPRQFLVGLEIDDDAFDQCAVYHAQCERTRD